MKLVRIVKETGTYVEIGEVNSTSEQYWERDFKPNSRCRIRELDIVVEKQLRKITEIEEAIYAKLPR